MFQSLGLTNKEMKVLASTLMHADFVPHPSMESVEISPLDESQIPSRIQNLIVFMRGKVLSCGLVRTRAIPQHTHTEDSEIYFSGNALATICMYDEDGALVRKIPLSTSHYALTKKGESHSAVSPSGNTAVFFYVRFA